ncbi:MAG: hypothetical protein OJI67_16725 [Prosthecobacter sp.]|nr:hypothetical protein [Prosthecobacter sp.]
MSSVPFINSLALFLGAMILSVTSSLAIATLWKPLGKTLAWPLILAAKGVALFSLTALIWAFIGLWVGHLGLPVSSLMLTPGDALSLDFTARLAQAIWWWVPPIFLLSVPLTAALLAGRLLAQRSWYAQVFLVGLFGIALLGVVEDAFHLPGALAAWVPKMQSTSDAQFTLLLWPPVVLGLIWWGIVAACPRTPATYTPTSADLIRDGSLVIGLSPWQAWKQNQMATDLRKILSFLFSCAAFCLSLWVAYGCAGAGSLRHEFHAAYRVVINDPWAPLLVAWPYALCALLLWVVSRIILPRSR